MADLGTLALGTYANVSSTAAQGSDPLLEVIASADDADYAYDATNSTHTGSCYFALADMPAGFLVMSTLSIRLRYHWATGTQTNTWDTLAARCYASDGSTALTDQVTVASSITTTTPTNSLVIPFTGVVASDKTTWDGARVYVYWAISKVKSGDTLQKRVTAGEITGTYSSDLSVNVSAAAAATGTASDPDPSFGVQAGVGSATGSALAGTMSLGASGGVAVAAGSAWDAFADIEEAGGGPLSPDAGVAETVGAAHDAGAAFAVPAMVAG